MQKRSRFLCFAIVLALLIAVLAGCTTATTATTKATTTGATTTGSGATTTAGTTLDISKPIELTHMILIAEKIKEVDNPSDVVTPYLEERFNIKVTDIAMSDANTPSQQMLNLRIAANDIPDVIQIGTDESSAAIATGKFADMTKYIEKMDNMNSYFDQTKWGLLSQDGKKYRVPAVLGNPNDPKYADDPFCTPNNALLWVREDILKQCGYSFTPLEELAKTTTDLGKKPTFEQYAITPALDTPDKFTEFLRKAKALNIKIGDKPLIPFDTFFWGAGFHTGAMYDFGHWRLGPDGPCSMLGSPGAKDWYTTLWTWYTEGLIDQDYLTQKDDQLQSKAASGQVASFFSLPNRTAAIAGMATVNPEYKVRPIPFPKQDPNYGCYDLNSGFGWGFLVSNRFTDEELTRLTQYWDWFYSKEGLDILMWGPESAGLWEMKDGKKQFKDPDLVDSLLNGTSEGKHGTEYYGLYTPTRMTFGRTGFLCRAAICSPVMELYVPYDNRSNYPVKLNMYKFYANVPGLQTGFDTTGKYCYGDGSEIVNGVATYFWSKFVSDRIGALLSAKTKEEFDKAWDEQYDLFVTEGMYKEAQALMVEYYKKYPPAQ
jgi:putative aldouronate transport system substrate-binding protein